MSRSRRRRKQDGRKCPGKLCSRFGMRDNDRFQFCCSRKNMFEPVMGLVTALLVLTMAGAVETVVQTVGETKLVVDCNVKPVALVGHSKTKLAPERMVDSGGRLNASNPALKLVAVSAPAGILMPAPE